MVSPQVVFTLLILLTMQSYKFYLTLSVLLYSGISIYTSFCFHYCISLLYCIWYAYLPAFEIWKKGHWCLPQTAGGLFIYYFENIFILFLP